MSKLEEMVETFLNESIIDSHGNVDPKVGLLAVFEKHVKAMVAEAWRNGYHDDAAHPYSPDAYAERVISELKGK